MTAAQLTVRSSSQATFLNISTSRANASRLCPVQIRLNIGREMVEMALSASWPVLRCGRFTGADVRCETKYCSRRWSAAEYLLL